MAINVAEITSVLKKEIQNFEQKVQVSQVGTVIEVGDGIARIYGLQNAMAGELLEFENGTMGQVFNLEEDSIGSVIFGVPAVTLHPMPFDSMRRTGVDKLLPELCIFHRLPVGGLPAVSPPPVDPLRHSVADIVAVGEQLDPARSLQGLERLDRGHQLHPIVGGQRFAAGQLEFLRSGTQKRAPSARTGVSAARSVTVDFDLGKLRH